MKIKTNFRLEVTPESGRYFRTPVDLEDCEEIRNQIKRHVDNVDRINILNDEECEFCGSAWEEAEKDIPEQGVIKGQPICCSRAEKEFKENQEKIK